MFLNAKKKVFIGAELHAMHSLVEVVDGSAVQRVNWLAASGLDAPLTLRIELICLKLPKKHTTLNSL